MKKKIFLNSFFTEIFVRNSRKMFRKKTVKYNFLRLDEKEYI